MYTYKEMCLVGLSVQQQFEIPKLKVKKKIFFDKLLKKKKFSGLESNTGRLHAKQNNDRHTRQNCDRLCKISADLLRIFHHHHIRSLKINSIFFFVFLFCPTSLLYFFLLLCIVAHHVHTLCAVSKGFSLVMHALYIGFHFAEEL